MKVSQVLRMNGGEGDHSYFNNSLFQKKVILTIKPILEASIEQLCENFKSEECLKMVDMGCSSGPNTLLPLLEIIQTMDYKFNKNPPMLQFFLNDLPGNDFNTVFRSLLPGFYQKLKTEKGSKFKNCFVAAMPGSFYEILFPPNSLHFVFSSYSLHWCSQIPYGLVSKSGIPLNKGNICIDKSSPKSVRKAYLNQFEKDFTKFLRSRSEEMVSGGHMVLTFMAKGGKNKNTNCKYGCEVWQLMGNALRDMVNEGMLEEQKLDNCNVPLYAPSAKKVRKVIDEEGFFRISRVEEFELSWDTNIEDGNNELVFDKRERGKYVADYMRAVAEPILSTHFGEAIIHNLFHRLSSKVVHCLENKTGVFNNVTFSMIRN